MRRTELQRLAILQTALIDQLAGDWQQAVVTIWLPVVRGQILLALHARQALPLTKQQVETIQTSILSCLAHQQGGQTLTALWQTTLPLRYGVDPHPGIIELFTQLELANWDAASLSAYARELQRTLKQTTRPIAPLLRAHQRALHQVGSPLYHSLFQAYGQQTTDRLVNQQKINLVLRQLGAELDEHEFLQLTAADYQIDPMMPPDAPFIECFAHSVQYAFAGQVLDDPRIHQFRMYVDRQNINYMRNEYRQPGETDEQALKRFVQARQKSGAQYWLRREPARLHNKYQSQKGYRPQAVNVKRVTPNFHSEFMLDPNGRFVSQWSVLREQINGRIDSDPAHYRLDAATCRQLLNGESLNYANRNDAQHQRLDSQPPLLNDHALRKAAFKGWTSPTKRQYQAVDQQPDGYSRWYI